MIDMNEYFDGKVKSLGPKIQGQKFTVGVIMPGSFEFGTGVKELMDVTHGWLEVEYEGHPTKKYSKGQSFSVPAETKFKVRAEEPASYVCYYG
ncbi:pyrimidine/purine nucleoside phosphorylase [candidate division WOR-3 bacterium]|nr:pyrimidine/purine nucleoside phosphorylase [candidate division WOR-3 bacterium]